MHDLLIIGGGPAGTAAAITAARAGAQVLLLERGRFPRHKVCGEFVSGESLQLLSSLLGPDSSLLRPVTHISQARLFLDGYVLKTAVNPPAASIARIDLDTELWKSALATGADVRQETIVQRIDGSGPFRAHSTSGEFEAKAVINASGRWSNLNVPTNMKGKTKWLGLKAHFAEPSPSPSVDLYFFHGGYCGVSPVNVTGEKPGDRINSCVMVRADVASSLQEVFRFHPGLRARSRDWQPLTDPVTTSPLVFRQPVAERNGVLMAGDAAGFVDPFVGDGISLALRSGSLAAECLLPFVRGEISHAAAVCRYRQAYEQWLSPVFRASSAIRRVISLPRAVRVPLIATLEKTPSLMGYLVEKTR